MSVSITVEAMICGTRSGRPAELVVADSADVINAIRAEAARQMAVALGLFSGAHNGLDSNGDGPSEEALSILYELAVALVDATRTLYALAPPPVPA